MSCPRVVDLIELLKPLTWFAPMWAYACGVVCIDADGTGDVLYTILVLVAGVVLAGPLLCASSQAVNDWQDRHVDAINQPERPIPSGRVSVAWAAGLAFGLSGASLLLAAMLGRWVLVAAMLGLMLSWAYSVPPVRLKRDGWWGNGAVAVSYEGLAWFAGAAVMARGFPGAPVVWLAALYSLGAHGIMTLNDFKAVAGDRAIGITSLPVRYGVAKAARLACLTMAVPQVIVVVLLCHWQAPFYGLGVAILLGIQVLLMRRFLRDPTAYAAWYNATGTSAYVLGMMLSAVAIRGGA